MKTILSILAAFILVGCSISPVVDSSLITYPISQVSLYGGAEKDALYRNEIEKGASYNLGISFSGGGVRSATFSQGAMAGLDQSGLLDRADIVSTVSGGGYAGYWLMSQLYYNQQQDTEFDRSLLFNDCFPDSWDNYAGFKNTLIPSCELDAAGDSVRNLNRYRFQSQVTQQSDLLHYYQDGSSYGRFLQATEFTSKVLLHIPSLISHHIGNTLFDWGYGGSGFRRYYQSGIERTYGLAPIDIEPRHIDLKRYKNQEKILWMDNYKAEELSFEELSSYTLRNWKQCSIEARDLQLCSRVPMWIINSTAGVADRTYEWTDEQPPLNESIFEVTPFGYGSGEYGYVSQPIDQITVPKAIAISGAAADAQQKTANSRWSKLAIAGGLHLINGNLGYSIDNYNPDRSNIALHRFLPFPLYYFHGFARNQSSVDIYLSDGGHSENLGAYSLIMRGVKNIVIFDAENDASGNFEAYYQLKEKLFNEEGLILEIEGLSPQGDFNPYDAPENIFTGTVRGFQDGYLANGNTINVVYVKSSLVSDQLSEDCSSDNRLYPCSVYKFHTTNNLDPRNECKLKNGGGLFPHHSTATTALEFSQSIYNAYRDLAWHVARRLSWDSTSEKVVVEPLANHQEKHKIRECG